MSKHVWGYWDCDCGRSHIRGDKTDCPGCGRPRNSDTVFYMDADNVEYVDDAVKNEDPDWICGFCGSGNSSKLDYCARCGASKEDNDGDYFDYHSGELEESETSVANTGKSIDIEVPADSQQEKISIKETLSVLLFHLAVKLKYYRGKIVIAAGTVLAVTALVFFFTWLFTPVEHHMTIDGFEWSRNIEIEELRTFDESGWSLPNEARLQYTRNEIHHYEDVLDHYETKSKQVPHQRISGYEEHTSYRDLGNGQFEEVVTRTPKYETYYETEYYQSAVYRQEPRYATKYYYEIDRWVHGYDILTSGFDKKPYWGTYVLGARERKGKSTEKYFIVGIADNKQQKFTLPFADWNRYALGDEISFTTYRFSSDILEILS